MDLKKVGSKKQGHCYSKREEAQGHKLNHVFKNSGCRLTGQLGSWKKNPTIPDVEFGIPIIPTNSLLQILYKDVLLYYLNLNNTHREKFKK